MTDDRDLADLLGGTPAPTAAFRLAVFARAAVHARRAEARRRAALRFAPFAALGLAVPIAGAFGATLASAEPLLIVLAALGAAGCAALAALAGPHRAVRFILGR